MPLFSYKNNIMIDRLPLGGGVSGDGEQSAVDAWDGSLSYTELDRAVARRCELLANFRGPITSLCPASADYIISFLCALRLGRPIMPLAVDTPIERLNHILDKLPAGVVLIPASADVPPGLVTGAAIINTDVTSEKVIRQNDSTAEVFAAPDNCAYIVTTSGSTGEPKMIAGSREGLESFIDWECAKWGRTGSRISFLSAPVFDVSLRDMLLPLATRSTVCIPDPSVLLDGRELCRWLASERIELTHIVPTLLRTLYSHFDAQTGGALASLAVVASAGEPLYADDVQRLRENIRHDLAVWNLYGPSETSLARFCYDCPAVLPDVSPLPVGEPLPGTSVRLFGTDGKDARSGEKGQIGIQAVSPSLGYIVAGSLEACPVLTAKDGSACFPTGDLGSFASDGMLLIHGRLDRQVKIRGQRVEPGEIEIALRKLDGVANGVIVVRESSPGEKVLLGYVVLENGCEETTSGIREKLAASLPDYMVPSRVIAIDDIPLTRSGKVSVRDLPEPGLRRPDLAIAYRAPTNENEQLLATIWQGQLDIDHVGIDDTFFDLGGTSLQAQHIVARCNDALGRDIAVADFFEFPTISSLAAWLERDKSDYTLAELPIRAQGQYGSGPVPIAIVGLAGSFPGARSVEELWRALAGSDDLISRFGPDELDAEVDREIASRPNYVAARGLMPDVDAFDARFFGITPREAELMDPQQRVFLQTCWHALEDAAYVVDNMACKTGVFAGSGDNSYLWHYVLKNPEAVAAVGEHLVHLVNERDYLATRVAYKLNLKGPAISVSTGCSTSLVAVCQAVESIRSGQCDAAIAGGVYVPAPHRAGYLFQEGGFGSSDGLCRPFDKNASGTVFSSGTGAVVLRRLDQALQNKDRIYAVIRGVGLNNDGADKMSFMAPSVAGQRDVIRAALDNAGVSGADVGYVEAHGTATPIGDPIEVSALAGALGEAPEKSRLLSSLKGHLGHLDAAAGVAGLIKVAKSMQTGVIPGTAHFVEENPDLRLNRAGFRLSAEPTNWRDASDILRAGVSSFGVGGTNAHIIVESAKEAEQPTAGRTEELILVSAENESSLSQLKRDYASHFSNIPVDRISDAAWTLARGRKPMTFRTALAGPVGDLARTLSEHSEEDVAVKALQDPDVAFVFPGQGSQHIGMGRGLYEKSQAFRLAFDYGADYFAAESGVDLRSLLFESPADDARAIETLTRTSIAQPAMFIFQHALSTHWASWGVRPAAVMGHSIGEFAAAVIANVMSLDSALQLVVARGRLVEAQPGGSMLSVRASAEDASAYLGESVDLAAVNAPKLCVLSGPTEAISALDIELTEAGIPSRVIPTSHAFHSHMMEPARQEFEDIVARQALGKPTIRYLSTLTGADAGEGEADVTNPAYWGRHLRYGVRFSDAVRSLWRNSTPVVLDMGPRNTAATMVRQHVTDKLTQRVVSSLNGSSTATEEWLSILKSAGDLWANGIDVDWPVFFDADQRRVMSLPNYAFAQTRYWLGTSPAPQESLKAKASSVIEIDDTRKTILEIIQAGSGMSLGPADFSRSFVELGLDSLFLTQFGIQLQKQLGVHIGLRDLMESFASVTLLAAKIDAESGESEARSNAPARARAHAHRPPITGAFVGLDENKQLRWFTENPEGSGKYQKVVSA